MDGQTPVILAQLPKPARSSNGNSQFGSCYGLSGSRKRKRFEIAAAIDGETLNVYNIQASQLLSSYAVPPTSSFQCPPTSLSHRNPSGSTSVRYTVCAVQGSDCQIQCFQETIGASGSPTISSFTHNIDEQNPACYVDFIPAAAKNNTLATPPDILVVHEDGMVRRLSIDLHEVRWIATGIPKEADGISRAKVACAQWVSRADASQGLLRRRADILKENAASKSSFLLLVYLDKSLQDAKFKMGVFGIPTNPEINLYSSTSTDQLRVLISHPIPASKWWTELTDVQFYFHAPTARLSMSFDRELSTFDLSHYEIRNSAKFVTVDAFVSVFPLTANLAAAKSWPTVQIYNTDYHSAQVSYELNDLVKRRGRDDKNDRFVRFVSYFAKIDTLVALLGRQLIGFQLPETTSKIDKLGSRSLLIDSLGRGAYQRRTATTGNNREVGYGPFKPLFLSNHQGRSLWEARKRNLDKLVAQNEMAEFERLMAIELRTGYAKSEDTLDRATPDLPTDQHFVAHDNINYLLSKMFCNPKTAEKGKLRRGEIDKGEEQKRVALAFVPDQLFRWLARRNCLSTEAVERALSAQPVRPRLGLGAVAQCIMDHDPSLSLFLDYLQGDNLLNLDEIVVTIKALIRLVVEAAESDPGQDALLLEDAHNTMMNGLDTNGDVTGASQIGHVQSVGGLPRHHTAAINRALQILCVFSPWKMTSAIRRHLANDESLALIQYLRQQLFRSGHTSSSVGFTGTSPDPAPPLKIIALVLSSCIDALGPAQLVGSRLGETTWQDLVPDLKVEISLALGAIEEATYLRGILQEMVRHSNATNDQRTSLESFPSAETLRIKPAGMAPEMAMSMDNELADEESLDLTGYPSMLPLGSSTEAMVTRTKKRKGGGEIQQRSGRELHYLRDRKVGLYTFERIVI